MLKFVFIALLSLASVVANAQASAPEASASAPSKHKWVKKLKSHKPITPATNPEASPDKKGGQ